MSAPVSRWSVRYSMEPIPQSGDKTLNSTIQSCPDATETREYQALTLVLSSRLAPRELAQCRAVCKLWRDAASSTEVRRSMFLRHWQLGGLVGEPRNPALLDTATLGHFVRRHTVVRSDTLTGLAVRHGCEVPAIMRLNNLISHHSLHSREAVFLPVSRPSELVGTHVRFHYCRIACRELLVVLGAEEAAAARRQQQQQQQREGAADSDAGGGEIEGCGLRRGQEEALQGKLVALLGRSRHVDSATARFYLAEAGWCLKKALQLFEQDLQWESRAPGGRRRRSRAPLQPLQD